MSVRTIVKIDEEKCTGCGLCVPACAEGALQIIDGKARLVSEIYCDGLGACLGTCPFDAITIETREADEFDEEAVELYLADQEKDTRVTETPAPVHQGCPGSLLRTMDRSAEDSGSYSGSVQSRLGHWPVQLKLVPPSAPYLKDADILVCADCVPFALAGFHERYLSDRVVLVGCPKLDDNSYYRNKLEDVFREAHPRSITVLRMEVPCCSGLAHVAVEAAAASGAGCDVEVHTIGIGGDIIERRTVRGDVRAR